MKQTISKISVMAGLVFIAGSATSFAAGLTLTNGGLGQIAANSEQFGVAVCAGADQALSQAVPVAITANGKTETISSASAIKAGSCEYSYLPYSDFAMQGGQSYSIDVTVDPQHTVSSNSNNETVYTAIVPAQAGATAQATHPGNLTANVDSQFTNPLTWLWNWLGDLFRSF